jgi:hypothetical protein
MIFVLYLHDGFARRALPDIIDSAIALDDHQVQLMCRLLGERRRRARQGDTTSQQET